MERTPRFASETFSSMKANMRRPVPRTPQALEFYLGAVVDLKGLPPCVALFR